MKNLSREVVELNLTNLPAYANPEDLKLIAGVKHVVHVNTDLNNLTNQCTGTGSIQFRLGDGETKESVVQRLEQAGVQWVDKPRPGGLNNNYTDISYVNWNDHHNQV